MAKYRTSGLIQSVKGSIGDKTFYYWKGIPVIRKKMAKKGNVPDTSAQKRIKKTFSEVSSQWKKLSFAEWALWEEYTKRYTKPKTKRRNGLVNAIGGKMSGFNAFMSTNHLLILSGFDPIKKPVLGKIGKPSLPKTDLIDFGVYEKEIKFNVRLPSSYPAQSIVQVWVKKTGRCYLGAYIRTIVPVSTSPTYVIIDKIKVKESGKVVEKELKNIEDCKLLIQMRTVAANGEFSMPSAIYRIEMKE